MDMMELETLTEKATEAVANLLPAELNVSTQDDGGGEYICITLDDEGNYLLFSAPTLFNGEDAPWQGYDGEHYVYFEQDTLNIHSAPEAVVEWIISEVAKFKTA